MKIFSTLLNRSFVLICILVANETDISIESTFSPRKHGKLVLQILSSRLSSGCDGQILTTLSLNIGLIYRE